MNRRVLVDCFFLYEDAFLFGKRVDTDQWFPNALAGTWREVGDQHPKEVLTGLFSELGVQPHTVKLAAIANNQFKDTDEVFLVMIYYAYLSKKPDHMQLSDCDDCVWLTHEQALAHPDVLEEYKQLFPHLDDDKIISYSCVYNGKTLEKTSFFETK